MEELIGQTLGQYRIRNKIGEGGMAVVYRAYQASLERYVAIKVLPPNKDPGFTARFQREARSIANLSHPNILAVHDFGVDQGYSYIAMHFVEGGKTMHHLAREKPGQERLIEILIQVANALDYAHNRGIIHRDIKPGNVLIEEERPLLADFGLAKLSHEAGTRITNSDVHAIGTPAYMSPEQGYGRDLDHRTDIYALGIMLYEVLTGKIPHEANTPIGIIAKRNIEPVPTPRDLNPNISPGLEQVTMRALQVEPDKRYPSAAAFANALQQAARDTTSHENLVTEALTIASPVRRSGPEPETNAAIATSQAMEGSTQSAASIPLETPPKKTQWKNPWVIGSALLLLIILLWGGFAIASGPQAAQSEATSLAELANLSDATPTLEPAPTFTSQPVVTQPGATSIPQPEVINFSASTMRITAGESLTLAWAVEGVNSVSVAPIGAGYPARHHLAVSPLADTVYILNAANGSQQVEPVSIEIEVLPPPSSTPLPATTTPTPSVTPTSIPATVSATPAPAITATPHPPTVTPTPDLPQGSFTLHRPLDLELPTHGLTLFEWSWHAPLPADQGFEIQVWREGESPAGVHNAVLDNQQGHVKKIGDDRYQLETDITDAYGVNRRSGIYLWTVKLVQISPDYVDLGIQADLAQLRFDLPGSSGGSSGGGDSTNAPSSGGYK